MIVPVVVAQAGWTIVVAGALGTSFVVSVVELATDTQPFTVFFVIIEYVPAANAFDVAEDWNVVPLSKL